MSKQTFTIGQVLTAAQMTSLQETAMGGGPATAKTASYVLVAADAGTTVAMNAAGSTTITVNTGLFAAGDTVFIQNLGAGACTVTAGTATVATAGSLILPQNDAGILYFTATGAAIFYDYIQAGAVSPLTTKGDLYTFSTSDARLGVGANNTVLTADSAEATGLKWATPAGGGGMTVIATGSLSGTSVVLSSIPGTYKHLMLSVYGATWDTAVDIMMLRYNSVTTNYSLSIYGHTGGTAANTGSSTAAGWLLYDGAANNWQRTAGDNHANWTIYDYTNTTGVLNATGTVNFTNNAGAFCKGNAVFGNQATAAAITSLTIRLDGSRNMTAGTYTLYGVA